MNGFNRHGQKIVKDIPTMHEILSGPCPDGDNCPDARKYGEIHPDPCAGISEYCRKGGITLHDIEQAFRVAADAKEFVRVVSALKSRNVFSGWPVVQEAYNPMESSAARMVRE